MSWIFLSRFRYQKFVVAFAFAALSLALVPCAHAALYNASGLLGHPDQNGNPLYTLGTMNNVPNAYEFDNPENTALDPVNHRLFVADVDNNRVLVFSLDANNDLSNMTASYILGQPNSYSTGVTTTQSGLSGPEGVAYDASSSRLFVADGTNNRVLVFNAATSTITTGENAENVLGQANYTAHVATTTQSGLSGYDGLAYDASSSRLFVADEGNNRVMVFNVATSTITNGENAENVLGQANYTASVATTTQSGLNVPLGVAYDASSSRLFVADEGNNRVMVFAATSTITNGESAENVLGQANYTASVATTTQNGLDGPEGVAYDASSSRLFVGDLYRVMVFAATSTITNGESAENVLGQANYTAHVATTTQNGLNYYPDGLAYDPTSSNLFVADRDNNRVMVFNTATSTITNGENAKSMLGHPDQNGDPIYTAKSSSNNFANAQGLWVPTDVALDPINHRLFVADSNNNRVLVFPLDADNALTGMTPSYILGQPDSSSNESDAYAQNNFYRPQALAYDPVSERLFVADYARVLVFNVATSTITNDEDAENVLGQANYTAEVGTTTQSGLSGPDGLAYDASSSLLFVGDGANSRVLVFNAATSTITNGENAENVLGQANYTASVATTTQSGFDYGPQGLAYDVSSSRLFATDGNNSRILIFNVATITNDENAENVLGQANYTASVATTTQSGLQYPEYITYDASLSRLFVTDTSNNRVMVFDAATSTIANGENAESVIGQASYTASVATITQSGLGDNLYGLAYDPSSGHLFVTDASSNRILQYSFIKLTTGSSLSSGTSGSSYSATLNTTSTQGTISFALASGSLPSGLSLATSTGIISGTPTEATTTSFSIEADDSFTTGAFYDTEPFTLTIDAASTPPPASTVIVDVPSGGTGYITTAPSTPSAPPSSPASSSIPSVPSITPSTPSSPASTSSLQAELASLESQLQALMTEAQAGSGASSVSPPSSSSSPSAPSSFLFSRNLSLWMTGNDVQELQVYLNTHGYPLTSSGNGSSGYETQTFGPKTYDALVKFQEANDLPGTGFFGPLTREVVNG